MPAQFPTSPSVGTTYTFSGVTWIYRAGGYWDVVSSGNISAATVSDTVNTSTGYFDLPSGTTAQRPSNPPNGAIRQNTTTLQIEYYNGTYQSWMALQQTAGGAVATTFDLEYLVVAGGGGGGRDGYPNRGAGGGGAGGFRTGTGLTTSAGTNYTVTVGGGGSRAATAVGTNGSNSVFGSIASAGGGGGGGGSASGKNSPGSAGTVNTGGGGGAAVRNASSAYASGAGGSGIVILRIPNLYTATFSAGITANVAASTSQVGYRTYTVTGGTGTVTFN